MSKLYLSRDQIQQFVGTDLQAIRVIERLMETVNKLLPMDDEPISVSTLNNLWTGSIRYIKRAGFVSVFIGTNGASASGTGIFTLPQEYAPPVNVEGLPQGGASFIQIATDGEITAQTGFASTAIVFTYPVL